MMPAQSVNGGAELLRMDYEPIQLTFADSILNTYYESYDNFIKKCELGEEIFMSQKMLYDRARSAIEVIRKNSDSLDLRPGAGILRGIDLDQIEHQLQETIN